MATTEELNAQIEAEARKGDISLDEAVYQEARKDPYRPILFGGNLDASTAFFARDLGRHEVIQGQPLIGDAGQRVRKAVFRYLFDTAPPAKDAQLAQAVQHVLLTNTVPYKPVGNKAYPASVKERLRPYVAQLLVCHFKGHHIITMGTEAFDWFKPYADRKEFDAFWKRPDKFEAEFTVTLKAECDGQTVEKQVTLAPLPHPSPLNQTWLERFPGLLDTRLEQSPLKKTGLTG
jgi:uracil-DNA glycosylase